MSMTDSGVAVRPTGEGHGTCPTCTSVARHPGRPSGVDAVDLETGTLVRLWGEVDASLRDQASLAMARAMARGGAVVIDTAQVEFLDSSGLAFILQLFRCGAEQGTKVVLRDPPDLLLDMLELLGLRAGVALEFSSC